MAKSKTASVAQTSSKSQQIPTAQVAQPTLADRIAAQEQELKNMEASETPAASSNGAGKHAPTKCPVSRAAFKEKAKSIVVDVSGTKFVAQPREFNTGSLGYYIGEKMVITVDGVPCRVQVTVNLTLVGSKELPQG